MHFRPVQIHYLYIIWVLTQPQSEVIKSFIVLSYFDMNFKFVCRRHSERGLKNSHVLLTVVGGVSQEVLLSNTEKGTAIRRR